MSGSHCLLCNMWNVTVCKWNTFPKAWYLTTSVSSIQLSAQHSYCSYPILEVLGGTLLLFNNSAALFSPYFIYKGWAAQLNGEQPHISQVSLDHRPIANGCLVIAQEAGLLACLIPTTCWRAWGFCWTSLRISEDHSCTQLATQLVKSPLYHVVLRTLPGCPGLHWYTTLHYVERMPTKNCDADTWVSCSLEGGETPCKQPAYYQAKVKLSGSPPEQNKVPIS